MTRNIERNPVSEIYAHGEKPGILGVFGLGDEKYREKLVSEIYAHGEKPGILGVFGWVTRNIERNPVSEIYAE
ncbi:hypothetical protein IQ269_21890 [Tychonema sp. LEGE 07199]|uniref:hypothetical protein n=1 Tax=Tychonema sp. LEGE 07199 TaxID=1828668 RepID=UPI0018802724|nr:hypothetical protein [Tychonema sp. LEGE 07199]MBE9123374.1 hypothetical protein [Tychonema sp. LEGE 07199]